MMKKLQDILYRVRLTDVVNTTDTEVGSIHFDSRAVEMDGLFVAVRGTQVDGHEYIEQAIGKGAKVVVCEELPEEIHPQVHYIKVYNSAEALGIIADNFFGNPSSKLAMIGITGTNGKTTVATLLFHLFKQLGYKVGLLSTVQNQINDEIVSATHTTPDAIQLNKLLAEMVEAGCEYCFMEASSHAIHQSRTAGLTFAGAVFTNISHDHLDYHNTFDEYIKAKKTLFDQLPSSAFALTNLDDKRGLVMTQNTKAKKKTYSLRTIADFKAKVLENSFEGMMLNMDGFEVHSKLIGDFNAYNLLAVYAVAQLLEQDKMETLSALSLLDAAEGRFDYIISEAKRVVGIVDYAHTPDALKKVLASIKAIRTGAEKVITVVGCGGNRDKDKRPVMARIACEMSDQVVLTSDNPRNEKPEDILADMQAGVTPNFTNKVLAITDRKEAIRTAVALAESGDIILIAGKGHEKYQDIGGVKHPFDDKEILAETLKSLAK